MSASTSDDLGKLVLRFSVGGIVLLHGIAKLRHGIDAIAGMVAGIGLPAGFAYAVYLGEVLGPLLLIIGFYARIGAVLIVANMIVAIALVHRHEILLLGDQGGWAIELQALMLLGAVASALLGPGRWALNQR